MSLRRRLLVGILVLLVAAIGVTDVVTYSSLRSFLLGRLDAQNDAAQHQVFVAVRAAYDRSVQRRSRLAGNDPTAWLTALVDGATVGRSTCATSVATARAATPGVGGARTGSGAATAAPTGAASGTASSAAAGATASAATGAPVGAGPAPGKAPTGSAAGRGRSSTSRFRAVSRVSPDVFVLVLAPDHRVLFARASGACDPRPRIPARFPVQAVPSARRFGAEGGAYFPNQLSFTVPAVRPGTTYRAEAVDIPGGILLSASALTSDDQTLASVLRVEAGTSVAVLAAAVLIGLLVTRFGLRPLDEMTETAGAIAAGDLGRRIRTTDTRSEVGRLGRALNGMLTQIEAAFAQRSRSEARLRRFVADASHELRTPLTSIRGYAELLRKGALPDAAARAQAAARIEHEAARMGVLVEDLLLLARLDQGRPLDGAPVDLAAVAADAVAAATVVRRDHPVGIEAPDPVVVTGDAVRLRQVVDNLVNNAIEHTPPGTPVTVSVVADGGEAVLRVADRGPGLTDVQASQVFEPFFRASPARTGTGVGLGLAIVDSLARAHGGRAQVEAEPGSGCRFEVRLPLAAPAPVEVPGSDPATTGAGAGQPVPGGVVVADGGAAPADGGTEHPAGEVDVAGGAGTAGAVPADGGAAPADGGAVPADGGAGTAVGGRGKGAPPERR